MGEVGEAVTAIPGEFDVTVAAAQLANVAERLKTMATEKGYHFDSLYEMAETQATDMQTVRNRVVELKSLLEVQRAILEQNLNQPIIKTWFELH